MTDPQHIRRSDAFTNAATMLMDTKEERGVPEGYPEFWGDIEELLIPLLEAEADGETAGMIPHLRSA